MWFVSIALFLVLAWVLSTRANELCVVELSNEGARLVRGRAPGAFLAQTAEIARRTAVTRTKIRIVTESQSPRLIAPASLSDDVAQRLRNVLGQYQVGQFRTGQKR